MASRLSSKCGQMTHKYLCHPQSTGIHVNATKMSSVIFFFKNFPYLPRIAHFLPPTAQPFPVFKPAPNSSVPTNRAHRQRGSARSPAAISGFPWGPRSRQWERPGQQGELTLPSQAALSPTLGLPSPPLPHLHLRTPTQPRRPPSSRASCSRKRPRYAPSSPPGLPLPCSGLQQRGH